MRLDDLNVSSIKTASVLNGYTSPRSTPLSSERHGARVKLAGVMYGSQATTLDVVRDTDEFFSPRFG